MSERGRLWRAAAWLGLVSDRPRANVAPEQLLRAGIVVVFCLGVIQALSH